MIRRQFDTLDGLRGVAALAVLVGHVPDHTFMAWLPTRHLAVDFFFVLSGFVLTHAYDQRLRGPMGLAEFMTRRYIRLWPLYLLATVVGLAALIGDSPSRLALIVSALLAVLFLPVLAPRLSIDHQSAFPLNSPAWSLFFELCVNLIYALVVRRLTNRVLAAILAVGAVLLVATWAVIGDLNAGSIIPHFWAGLGRVVWSYFAGVAVYRLWRARPAPRLPALALAAVLIAMFLTPWELVWPLIGFPALVYLAASAEPAGWTRRVFSSLGAASYGIYVMQVPLVDLISPWIDMHSPWATVIFAAGVVALVIVLDAVFDRPVRAWLEGKVLPWVKSRRAVEAS